MTPTPTTTTWFTSDQHFGHENILKFTRRGSAFSNVDEHDTALIDAWNSRVSFGDIVWVLGDYALGDRARGLSYLSRLNGTKYLVAGNHDRCLPGVNNNAHLYQREYIDAGFKAVFQWMQLKLPPLAKGKPGMRVMLSHFPYDGDHTEGTRFAEFRLQDAGIPLIHGHVHELYQTALSAQGTPTLNAGVDVHSNFAPISAREAHEFLAAANAGL